MRGSFRAGLAWIDGGAAPFNDVPMDPVFHESSGIRLAEQTLRGIGANHKSRSWKEPRPVTPFA